MSEEDSELLARWMREVQADDEDDDGVNAIRQRMLDELRDDSGVVDPKEELRMFGLNHHERESAVRPRKKARSGLSPVNARRQLARYLWHIENTYRAWPPSARTQQECARSWFDLTKGDLELAQTWWAQGLHPARVERAQEFILAGFTPDDLRVRVDGRYIAEHLVHGAPIEWCSRAIESARRKRREAN